MNLLISTYRKVIVFVYILTKEGIFGIVRRINNYLLRFKRIKPLKKKDKIYFSEDDKNKKTLLMINNSVPFYDRDAGSRSVFNYLKYFIEARFNIKFIANDFYRHEPYTSVLEQMGIEVLYGLYYAINWKKWIIKNGKYIDYVFLNRPLSIKYIDVVKKATSAKIIYCGHDLHFLRELREYNNTGNKFLPKISEMTKKTELEIMRKSDYVYLFSETEKDIIKEIAPDVNCKTVPLVFFNKSHQKKYNPLKKDLIFVGGFKHSPNIDGILWFINDVFPQVQQEIPEIVINIIGSNAPKKIKKLEDINIKILGYVDDNTLEDYYNKCRVCVVPLRYGAGIKGKVLEAMYNQIPVITTNIGAEGLPDIDKCLSIEDDTNKFAKALVELYYNEELQQKLIEKSHKYIMKNYTMEKFNDIISVDIK